jgi:hypothetical protein
VAGPANPVARTAALQPKRGGVVTVRVAEVALSVAALVAAVRSAARVVRWLSGGRQFSFAWIPYGYLAEAVALTAVILLALLLDSRRERRWIAVLWCCVGALAAFVLLSSWTVGSLFTPAYRVRRPPRSWPQSEQRLS